MANSPDLRCAMPARGPSTEKAVLTLEGPRGLRSPWMDVTFKERLGRARDVWSRKRGG